MESLNLDQFRWQNRIIVTYSNDPQSSKLSAFRQDIEQNTCGFKNRNLLQFHIIDKNQSDEFRVILIGKDGSVKFNGDTSLQNIFNQIDSMPMRRYEMQFDSC